MATETQFGPYFRAMRNALGLNLREFCRRNGFDPGNVSRLERGLTPPPQTQEGLEEYAKALKLERGTERWDRFFELAAAKTGRIPAELLGDQSAAARLPNLLRRLRGGPGHRNWVTARHLEEWANSLEARATLPQLVRRLVHGTGKTVTNIAFPAGEQTQRPGLDGVVDAADPDAFVPAGRSVWEMGVNKDPAAKAEDDFAKRRKQKFPFDKQEATYVVATPRKWQTKDAWIADKNKLGVWKEVRVYDSATLEEWLERAPAVDVWLARLLGLRPAGLIDIDEYWENLEALTEPSLKPEVFLASRQKMVEGFRNWLAGPSNAAAIETRSPAEAVDFAVAVIRESSTREAVSARALIVEEKEAWRAISRSDSELVLIAHPNLAVEPEMVAEAVRQGHHVVLSVSQSRTDRSFTLELPRVYRHDLQKALESSGFDRTEAGEYAGKAGGSLTVLKRLLAKLPGTIQPAWSLDSNGSALVPILLAGSWEDTSGGDREVLERLADRPYGDVAAMAEQWLNVPDPLLTRVLSRWSLVSRDDSWFLLSHSVTHDHLRRFEQVAVDVLGENDPALELPPDERWMASVNKKALGYSHALRTALAETLALLGGRSDRLPVGPHVPDQVGSIVRRLLEGTDWRRWASLSSQLPLLAEAAPDAFLRVVEEDLRRTEPTLPMLFEQDGRSPLFSSAPHAGFLWALEGLAWDRGLLPRVSYVLARLDELLVSKNGGNSPMRSLQEIFMPWFPQTTAPVEERVKILTAIARKNPGTGWRLLLDLLPDRMQHSAPIHRPAYRDWALAWREGATNADYARQVTSVADALVGLLGTDLKRWEDLIDHFENLAGPAGRKFLDMLRSFDVSTLDTPARRVIAGALREKVTHHTRFSTADWALPESIVTELEQAQRRFEPEDAVSRHSWLFNEIWEVLAREENTDEKRIEALRRAAVREVREESGWEGILAFAEAVRKPEELGLFVGEVGTEEDDERVLPAFLSSSNNKLLSFGRGYVWGRIGACKWPWVKGLKTGNWLATDVGKMALYLRSEPSTWEFVTGRGEEAEEYYWQNTRHHVSTENPADVRFAESMLLKYGRPFHACFVIGMALHKKCPVETELIFEVLEAGLRGPITEVDRQALGESRHYVIDLLQHLQQEVQRKESDIDHARVARLEWGYLDWLDGHPASPVTLHGVLKTEPKFFVDLLGIIFRPENEPEDAIEPSEEEKARAQNAYRLLMSWEGVPGGRDDGTVDEKALLDWVQSARSMAKEQSRLAVCDLRIGNVFAHAPDEPSDNGWPCIPVRDAIEEVGSEDLASGFEMGIYNKRGVYRKAFDEGGDQERDLAKRFRGWAEVCKIEWPRTAASLLCVAEGYEREASRADIDTQLRLT
jgi:transcriptional regulator with XRE-family HTH domain